VEGEGEVRFWSGVEREEVRKKKENEGKKKKIMRRKNPSQAARAPRAKLLDELFSAQAARSCHSARATRAKSLDDFWRPCLCGTQRATP